MKTLSSLSDSDLVSSFRDILLDEREALVQELEHLVELDRRKLYFEYPSLWAYLVEEHGIPEWAAEQKIRAARLLTRFPELKGKLESGKLNLSHLEMASRLASREKLRPSEAGDAELREVLESLSGLRCKAAKREIARRYPKSSVEDPPDRVTPVSGERSEIRFVGPNELLEKLEEIKGLLAHSHPGIKFAQLIDVLATEYRKHHHPEEKARRAQGTGLKRAVSGKGVPAVKGEAQQNQAEQRPVVESPANEGEKEREVQKEEEEEEKSRKPVHSPGITRWTEKRVPGKALVRELIRRDGYACSYVDPATGQRCRSAYALEIDHRMPWSEGGGTELRNLRFLCKGHHARVSFVHFGDHAKFVKEAAR